MGFGLYDAAASKSSLAGEFVSATEQCYSEDWLNIWCTVGKKTVPMFGCFKKTDLA